MLQYFKNRSLVFKSDFNALNKSQKYIYQAVSKTKREHPRHKREKFSFGRNYNSNLNLRCGSQNLSLPSFVRSLRKFRRYQKQSSALHRLEQ